MNELGVSCLLAAILWVRNLNLKKQYGMWSIWAERVPLFFGWIRQHEYERKKRSRELDCMETILFLLVLLFLTCGICVAGLKPQKEGWWLQRQHLDLNCRRGCLLHGTGINLVLLSLVSRAEAPVSYLTFHSYPTASHTTQEKYRHSRSVGWLLFFFLSKIQINRKYMLEGNHKRHDCLRHLLSPQIVESYSGKVSGIASAIGWRQNHINRGLLSVSSVQTTGISFRICTCVYYYTRGIS